MKSTIAITSIIFTIGLVTIPLVWGDGDYEWGERNEYTYKSSAKAVANPVYKEECGSCHMAYPARLLPARSWQKMMSDLEDHFGDNAELDSETHQAISQYLTENSSDKRSSKLTRKIKASDTPLRISELSYFIHEHDEIPQKMVKGNPEVNSFSQCNACHTKAEQGSFNEHNVRIPGYGKWDD